MNDTLPDTAAPAPAAPAAPASSPDQPPARPAAQPRRRKPAPRRADAARGATPARSHPVLDALAELHPALFGEVLLPLKRGIFQDLLDAHPQVFTPDELKAALSLHTRSTRYLTAVAAGQQRHDLSGHAVEAMAPDHVYQALLEVFRRRHARTGEDVRAKLCQRMQRAFEDSGLTREDYAQRMHGRDEAANALLAQALAEAAAQTARDEALLRAFDASGQTLDAFAAMYGLDPREAARRLERARKTRPPAPAVDGPDDAPMTSTA